MIKIAGVQMDVTLGEVNQNIENVIERFRTTTAAGAAYTVFPECALTGYCFNDLEEARQFAESIPGPTTDRLAQACADLNAHMVVGMLELDGTERLQRGCADRTERCHLKTTGRCTCHFSASTCSHRSGIARSPRTRPVI